MTSCKNVLSITSLEQEATDGYQYLRSDWTNQGGSRTMAGTRNDSKNLPNTWAYLAGTHSRSGHDASVVSFTDHSWQRGLQPRAAPGRSVVHRGSLRSGTCTFASGVIAAVTHAGGGYAQGGVVGRRPLAWSSNVSGRRFERVDAGYAGVA